MGPDGDGPRGHPGGGPASLPLSWYGDARRSVPIAPRRRWLRREDAVDAVAGLTLSALCFSRACRETLFHADPDFYHAGPLAAPVLVALLLNLGGLALAAFAGLRALRRVRRPAWQRLGAGAAAAAALVALNFARLGYDIAGSFTDAIGRPGLVALVALVIAVSSGWPRPALRALRGLGLVASPLGLTALALALWMVLEAAAAPVEHFVDPAPLKRPAPSLRRVVWLVFEELDRVVAFEAVPRGLELPELDRLRRESLYAASARPPAERTDLAMPALITGRPVVAVAPLGPNDLQLTFADGAQARWSTQPNVFSHARVAGYDTALMGWRLPYPRVLGSALGAGDWRPSVAVEQTRGDTVGEALRNQWSSLVPPTHVRRLRARRVEELGDLALRAAADDRFGLVLLHLPLPRPPAIYDRNAAHLTSWNFAGPEAEALDNLALVDRFMGALRHGLSRSHLADRTWLVVTSARGRGSPGPDGHVDHRVPFLVRPPEGSHPVYVDAPFNTLGTHDLVLAILRGAVADAPGAAAWLTRYPSAPPKGYTRMGRPIY